MWDSQISHCLRWAQDFARMERDCGILIFVADSEALAMLKLASKKGLHPLIETLIFRSGM